MSIKKSIYHRAKSFVTNEDLAEIFEKNKVNGNDLAGILPEMIKTCETLKNYKKKSNTLLDIGAHKGLFSKAANTFFRFDKTICFEPNILQNEIIAANNKGLNCSIENIALSDKEGEITFFLHQDDSMNSIVEADHSVLKSEFPYDNPDKMKETTVKTITLDGYTEKHCTNNETFFIKIDTQGNELNVFKHGIKTLKRTEVCVVEYMFFSPYKTDFSFFQFVEFMENNGFECKGALTISKRPSKKISAVDFFFVNKSMQ